MTRKQLRATMIGGGVSVLALAALLVLFAMRNSIVFFYAPSDLEKQSLTEMQRFRLGGLVAKGSIQRGEGTVVRFDVTDTIKTIAVRYDGILPDLFREEQGVVAEGRLQNGVFMADSVLAKHDETYMPPEVAKSLKEKGVKLGQGATHKSVPP